MQNHVLQAADSRKDWSTCRFRDSPQHHCPRYSPHYRYRWHWDCPRENHPSGQAAPAWAWAWAWALAWALAWASARSSAWQRLPRSSAPERAGSGAGDVASPSVVARGWGALGFVAFVRSGGFALAVAGCCRRSFGTSRCRLRERAGSDRTRPLVVVHQKVGGCCSRRQVRVSVCKA